MQQLIHRNDTAKIHLSDDQAKKSMKINYRFI